jgi:ribosomal protein S18 acetylase RimI-like enzyme
MAALPPFGEGIRGASVMIEKWFRTIRFPLSIEKFHQLPQNPAYKYEYIDGHAWLTPRPKSCHALLDLHSFCPPIDVQTEQQMTIRRLAKEDWELLPPLLALAFHRVEPFASLDEDLRLQAAEDCLGRTRARAKRPLISEANCVAVRESDQALVGAAIITLLSAGDVLDENSPRLQESAGSDAVAQAVGRPHLTWIFVRPRHARLGVGTALLDAAVGELNRLGYAELASTLLLGNESSMLWHWRIGFRPLSYPNSTRAIRQRTSS